MARPGFELQSPTSQGLNHSTTTTLQNEGEAHIIIIYFFSKHTLILITEINAILHEHIPNENCCFQVAMNVNRGTLWLVSQ